MSTAQANHDPALTAPQTQAQINGQQPADLMNMGLGMDHSQILHLLSSLPGGMTNLNKLGLNEGVNKEAAAEILSKLSQSQFTTSHGQHQIPSVHQFQQPAIPHTVHGLPQQISDPGPSSHPMGPPNLGQLSALAAAAGANAGSASQNTEMGEGTTQETEEDGDEGDGKAGGDQNQDGAQPSSGSGRARGSRSANMGSDEWARQRKDNHKEVERRRRGNINEGINELGRIVPNGSGEKAKGAILSRAVQYIHHLKENEARNIEKWTLEKLLMDQAMGDLQAQLEEMRRLWEQERMARQRLESELDVLRGLQEGGAAPAGEGATEKEGEKAAGQKEGESKEEEETRLGKRQRVE